jgi:GR25 family glycosyltransferase involved in LPS biosynthesis
VQCFYINLEGASARREQIERSFQQHRAPHWSLHRFPALDPQYVRQHGILGRIRDNEKACFASHRELVRATLHDEHPILVLEDDAVFCARTFTTLEQLLQSDAGGPCDITFTDVLLSDIWWMLELARVRYDWDQRHRDRPHPEFLYIDLARANFCAATAYVVHGPSKSRLVRWLDSAAPMDIPYDLYIRKLVHEGHLKARCVFPFLTTLSPAATASQLQLPHDAAPSFVWNTFRRLMWLGRDLRAERAALARLSAELCDEEFLAVGTVVAAMMSMFKSGSTDLNPHA